VRCALYARVSSEEQAERYGLSSQLRELRELAHRRGYAIVHEFVDDGWSGATLDRPQLTTLRSMVRARGVDVVLAHASDRLARDLGDLLVLRVEFRQAAARLEYVSHAPDDTPEGELREQMLGAIAQYERAKIRERTSRGRREQARQGRRPGGRAPFGYRLDPEAPSRLAIDEQEATWVRRMFAWAAEGASLHEIARRLDAQGCRTKRGRAWDRASLRMVLCSELYIGRGYYNRRLSRTGHRERPAVEWIAFPVPAIVPQALWDRAQHERHRNVALRSGRPGRCYVLKGLLVCGTCGRRLQGTKWGKKLLYRCGGRCGLTRSLPALDAAVWNAIAAVLRDPARLEQTARRSRLAVDARRVDAQTELAELRDAARRVELGRQRLLDLFVDGRLERAQYDRRARPLEAEAARLRTELVRVEGVIAAGVAESARQAAVVRYCRLMARGLDRLDDHGRQAWLRRLGLRIVVYADRLEIRYVLLPSEIVGHDITRPPTTMPRNSISMGSSSASRFAAAVWTSSSYRSATRASITSSVPVASPAATI
jgi:site-specific DNA recombinase